MIVAISTLGTVLTTVAAFLTVTLILVAVLLYVKQKLSPSGPVKIRINGEKEIEVASGSTLLSTLGNNKIFLPSACGGGPVSRRDRACELVNSSASACMRLAEAF